MPPRYAYWTILIDNRPTAFRAHERDELLPTLNQLRRKNTDVVMKWFARGRLWESPEEERTARSQPKPFEKRGHEWRPGGQHKDPRARFDRKKEAPEKRPWGPKPAGSSQGKRPWSAKPPGSPEGKRPWSGKPADSRGTRPWGGKPGGKPPGARPWTARPPRKENKSFSPGSFDAQQTKRRDGKPEPPDKS